MTLNVFYVCSVSFYFDFNTSTMASVCAARVYTHWLIYNLKRHWSSTTDLWKKQTKQTKTNEKTCLSYWDDIKYSRETFNQDLVTLTSIENKMGRRARQGTAFQSHASSSDFPKSRTSFHSGSFVYPGRIKRPIILLLLIHLESCCSRGSLFNRLENFAEKMKWNEMNKSNQVGKDRRMPTGYLSFGISWRGRNTWRPGRITTGP